MKSKEQKKTEAAERAVAYAALSDSEKMARAQARPGRSERELARLGKVTR